MSRPFAKLQQVSFEYPSSPEPLFRDLTIHFPVGWTGIIGANGTGKTTLLKLVTGLLHPDEGIIRVPGRVVYCPQRTDEPPENLDMFIASNDKNIRILKTRLAIADDWYLRWDTLSYGERKRLQIAVALGYSPALLALDEPTNHVDTPTRQFISETLLSFDGVGLLVSHDRELLDILCQQCAFVDPPDIILRPGGYSEATEVMETERDYQEKQHFLNKQALKKITNETHRRQTTAQQSKKRISKHGLSRKDHDARAKKNLAKLTGKDAVGGKLKRQMDNRLAQVEEKLDSIAVKKRYTMGIHLPGSRSRRDFLLRLPAGTLNLGETQTLCFPELLIKPRDRIGVTGMNGSGKSSLVRHVLKSLSIPQEHIVFIPQEILETTAIDILLQVRQLSHEQIGTLMTIVSRLGTRPHRLLNTTTPSPGEIRKLMLALGMVHEPHIIVMDEPTNHMDLPSIICLEEALSECCCALLLVSHDNDFLEKVTNTKWHIEISQNYQGLPMRIMTITG
jgi:macrolide transport system ATP-binding/permease protein